MKFSLNIHGNDNKETATSERISKINEELKMTNANNNIQLLTATTGAFNSTLRIIGALALAGMIAMTATFGSVSADEPSRPVGNDYYTGSLTDIPTASAKVQYQGF